MAATPIEIEQVLGTKMVGCGFIYYVCKLSNGETSTIDYADAMRLYPNSYRKTWGAKKLHFLDDAIWDVDEILMHNKSGDMLVKWKKEENEHYHDTWIDAHELIAHVPELVWNYLSGLSFISRILSVLSFFIQYGSENSSKYHKIIEISHYTVFSQMYCVAWLCIPITSV